MIKKQKSAKELVQTNHVKQLARQNCQSHEDMMQLNIADNNISDIDGVDLNEVIFVNHVACVVVINDDGTFQVTA